MNNTNQLRAIQELENWWNTQPAEGVRPPKQCFIQEDKVAAIWLSAWEACQKTLSEGNHHAR